MAWTLLHQSRLHMHLSDVFAPLMSPQNKTCVQTLEGHAQNVSCVSFHPELPIIVTGSEDGEFG